MAASDPVLLMVLLQSCIKIWDLESKSIVDELRPEFPPVSKKATVRCLPSTCSAAAPTAVSCSPVLRTLALLLLLLASNRDDRQQVSVLHAGYSSLSYGHSQAELDAFSGPRRCPTATSVAWSADGATLYTGYTDGKIRVLERRPHRLSGLIPA